MDRPARIAVVGPAEDRLVGDLRSLPLQPEVRLLRSLVADSEVLVRFQPDVLVLDLGPDQAEEVGAARLLRQMWPALGVVVVASADREVALAPVAARLGAPLYVQPGRPGQLAGLLEQVLHGGDRPRPEAYVDLAHGLADEINNPLMFAVGHAQLLRAALHPAHDRDRLVQLEAILAGLERIRGAIDRLRLLSQAAGGPRRREPVELAPLVAAAIATRSPGLPAATVGMAAGAIEVTGDREQLANAVAAIVRFADELAAAGATTHLQGDLLPGGCRLRIAARGHGLAAWQLAQSFEPFYPQRALRGQSHGLGLFLAQTVVLGHKGQATARRSPDGALQFDFVLPR